jgi:F-type H+-transporting ATPase subunit delta
MVRQRRAAGGPFGTRHCAPSRPGENRGCAGHLARWFREGDDERLVADTKASDGPGVSGVAGRYALALFELARDERAIDDVGRDLDGFSRLLAESEDLRRLIKSPVFSAEDQLRAIEAVLARAGIGGLAANLIRLVATKRRLFVLPDMIRDYKALVARHKGIVPAEVRLAEEPSSQMLEDIKSAVRDMAGSEVDLDVKIDPALIGGLVVKIGSRMVDASLKTKLNAIRIAMKEAR